MDTSSWADPDNPNPWELLQLPWEQRVQWYLDHPIPGQSVPEGVSRRFVAESSATFVAGVVEHVIAEVRLADRDAKDRAAMARRGR